MEDVERSECSGRLVKGDGASAGSEKGQLLRMMDRAFVKRRANGVEAVARQFAPKAERRAVPERTIARYRYSCPFFFPKLVESPGTPGTERTSGASGTSQPETQRSGRSKDTEGHQTPAEVEHLP